MKAPVVLSIVLSGLALCVSQHVAAQASGLDIVEYDLSMRFNLEQSGTSAPLNTLSATARITFVNRNGSPQTQIPAILYRLLHVDAIRDSKARPLEFRQRLGSLDDWHLYQANLVSIDLDQPLLPGATTTIEIDYGGPMVGLRESGMLYVRDSLDPDFTIIRGESASYPHLADPTTESLRHRFGLGNDVFDQIVSVVAPDTLVVASGLDLIERQTGNEQTTWRYRSREPSFQIILTVAPYEVIETSVARIYFFPEDKEGAQRVAKGILDAMALFEDWFGALDDHSTFTVVEIPEWYGSQALRPTVIQDARAFRDASAMVELYHEISHLWNVTDTAAAPSRWNEGLAMYLQEITRQELDGAAEGLDSAWESTFQWLKRQLDEHPGYREVPLIRAGEVNLTSVLSYGGGQLMFALLHQRLGRDQLLTLLGEFYQSHVASGATSQDFADFIVKKDPNAARIIDEWFLGGDYANLVLGEPSFAVLAQRYQSN